MGFRQTVEMLLRQAALQERVVNSLVISAIGKAARRVFRLADLIAVKGVCPNCGDVRPQSELADCAEYAAQLGSRPYCMMCSDFGFPPMPDPEAPAR